uniref:Putative conserved plasma membrane protein n=1 Tax=Desmodus rotundus TaxID=9430 RepID=K9IHW9_DESRO
MGTVKVSGRTAVAAVINLAILLLQFDFSSSKSSSLFSAVGTVNGSVILSPSNVQPFTEIMWKKGTNKVIEWDSDGVKSYPPFDGRVRLNNTSGDLHISNLIPSDEGEYEVEMLHSSNGMKFYLMVFDPLPSPMLQCELVNESIEVRCEVPKSYSRHQKLLNYSWHCRAPQCEGSTTPVLHFKKSDDLSEQVQCFVANPESTRTTSVVLSFCAPQDNSRHRYLLVPAIVIASLCMLIMCYWKYSRRPGPTA